MLGGEGEREQAPTDDDDSSSVCVCKIAELPKNDAPGREKGGALFFL